MKTVTQRTVSSLLSVLIIVSIMFATPIGSAATNATSGTTGDCKWSLDGTVLTISGNGAMGDFSHNSIPWGNSITKVIIQDGVTYIGN